MRTLFVSVAIISIISFLLLFQRSVPVTMGPSPSVTPTVSLASAPPAHSMDVAHNKKTYRIAWLVVADMERITLLPNFSQKRTARSLVNSTECAALTNGGFYTKEGQPTGLFMFEGATLHGYVPSALFNGFFVIDKDFRAIIESSPPGEPARIALQSGPVLIRNGKAVLLRIRDDEFARRMVAGVTQNGAVVFLAVYDADNPGSGPKLADTPALLATVASDVGITDALNLDGGSASAFIRGDLSLEELTAVGSFFCIR